MDIHEQEEWAKRIQGRYLEMHGTAKKVIGWGLSADGVEVTLHLEGFKPGALCVASGFDSFCWTLCRELDGEPYWKQPTNDEFLQDPCWENVVSRTSESSVAGEKACNCPLDTIMSTGCSCGGI